MTSGKSNIPGPSVSIASIIDHYTEVKNETSTYRSMPLRPSAAGKCARALAYELMEFRGKLEPIKEKQSADVTRIFSLGHSVETHLLWQAKDAFKAAEDKIKVKYQQQTMSFFKLPLTGELIQGQIDAVFEHDAWVATVDVKSKKDGWDKAYSSRWQEADAGFDKDPLVTRIDDRGVYIPDLDAYIQKHKHADPFFCDNLYQLNFYYWSECGFLRHRSSEFCSLLYYNKNSSAIREVRFKPSEAVAEYVKQKYLRVSQAVDGAGDPTLVEKESSLGSSRCAYCKFKEMCWDMTEYKVKKEYFKTLPPKRWPKRMSELSNTERLKTLFELFQKKERTQVEIDSVEREIITELANRNINKIELDDGDVFEVKSLSSGGKGDGKRQVLRRGKK